MSERKGTALASGILPAASVLAGILFAEAIFRAGVRLPALIYLPAFLAILFVAARGSRRLLVACLGVAALHVASIFARIPGTVTIPRPLMLWWATTAILWMAIAAALVAYWRRGAERAHERTEGLNRALHDANADLRAFTHLATHDLKEPVRGMVARLDALQEDHVGEFSASTTNEVAAIQRDAARLNALLADLLSISAAGRLSPRDLEVLDVAQIFERPECRARFEAAAAATGAVIDVERGLPPVLSSGRYLAQVFGNLTLNAIRHNARPSPRVDVRAPRGAAPPPSGIVRVELADNGDGFPREILDAFGRGASTSGFGLEIARKTIERLGGSLHIRNEPSGGVVAIELPAAVAMAMPAVRRGATAGSAAH